MEGLAVRTPEGWTTSIDAKALDAFRGRFRGSLIQERDSGDDEARVISTRMVAKKPALIARLSATGASR